MDGAANMAQQHSRTTLLDAQAFLAPRAEARHRAVSMAEMVRERFARAQLDAAAAGGKLRAVLAVWQSRLEKKAAAVCQLKLSQLHWQAEELEQMRGRVLALLDQLTNRAAPASDGGAEWMVRALTADHQLRLMGHAQLTPPEDTAVRFVSASGAAMLSLLRTIGTSIETSGCGARSVIMESSTVPVVGWPYQLMILPLVRDHYGANCRSGDDRMQASVVTADRRLLSCDVEHLVGGRARAAFVARSAGEHTFSLTANRAHMMHSPWTRRAVSPRRLSSLGPVRLTVGSEGTEPGQLCRLWPSPAPAEATTPGLPRMV